MTTVIYLVSVCECKSLVYNGLRDKYFSVHERTRARIYSITGCLPKIVFPALECTLLFSR